MGITVDNSRIDAARTALVAERDEAFFLRSELDSRITMLDAALAALPAVLEGFAPLAEELSCCEPHVVEPAPIRKPAKPTPAPRRRATQDAAWTKRVLALLAKAPASTGEIALKVDTARWTTLDRLRPMAQQGLIKSTGNNRSQRWHLCGATVQPPKAEKPAKVAPKAPALEPTAPPADLTDQAVLDTLRRVGGMATVGEIARRLQQPVDAVRAILGRLVTNEVLGRTGLTYSFPDVGMRASA